MNTPTLNKIKNDDFLEFGNSLLAFVKKENNDIHNNEMDVYAVYCGDGTLLATFESKESAIAAIIQSGLEFTNLH